MLTFEKMAREYVELRGGKLVSTRPIGDGRRSTLVQYPRNVFVSIASKYESPLTVSLDEKVDTLWANFVEFATKYEAQERTGAL